MAGALASGNPMEGAVYMALFGLGSSVFFNINLYGGLLVFIGFVFVDTQLMINRCENGQECDSYKDAMNMFIDVIS